MSKILRLTLTTALSLVLAAPLAAAGTSLSAPQWPQAHSDLPADPGVRFGVLANGLRYAVMKNATPAGQAAIRLRIGSGSLQESDAQQGLAHVLEHMAFKGSVHVPEGEMIKILQRKGLAFGPDTNAETGWTHTVYMLDLPKSDADDLDTGLMLMRETAGNLTLDPKALASERGVVLSEERLRDTPGYRAERAQIGLWLNGQLAAERWPIGLVDVIKAAPVAVLKDFYLANYRPERATLIVVGDFDPAGVEAKIKAGFSDWTGAGAAVKDPDLGAPAPRGLTVKVVQLPGASTKIAIAWARPQDTSPDSLAKQSRSTVENLGLAVLNRRLGKLSRTDNPPFLSASAGFEGLFHSAKLAVIEAESTPQGWRRALAVAEQEVRRLAAFGVGQAELDREMTEIRAGLDNAVAGAGTRPTPSLASGLVDAVDEDAVFTAPVTDRAVFDAAVKDLSPEKVNQAVKAVFAGAGPLVSLTGPDDISESAVTEAYAAAHAVALQAPKIETAMTWPYADFGKSGAVARQTTIADLGVQTVRFANGVGLTIKSTDFRKDQVLITVSVGGGRLSLPLDHATVTWAAGALIPGGLAKISYEDLQRTLAGRIHGESFAIGDDAFVFEAGTQPKDLAVQLQILAAYVTDAGYDPQAFERSRTAYLAALPQFEATPGGVLHRDLPQLIVSGDPRWAFPSKAALLAAKPADLKSLLQSSLTHGALEVTVVGDIDPKVATALVGATFGALPVRPAAKTTAPTARRVIFPAPTPAPLERLDQGRADQGVAMVAWPVTDFFADMRRSRAAILAGEVLENRLVDKVRIAEGSTYSPEAHVDLSQVFAGYGYAMAEVELPPAKFSGFYDSVSAITTDMGKAGVTVDELARAKNPRLATLRRARLTNEYWLANLSRSLADPRRLDLIRRTLGDYEAITPGEVQAAAKTWLVDSKAWKLVVHAASAGK